MNRITIPVRTGRPYQVQVEDGLLDQMATLLPKAYDHCRICLVSETTVAPLYQSKVQMALETAGHLVFPFVFAAGESSKNPTTLVTLLEFLCESHLTRSDLIIALGGGVTGDLAGLAAALFQRGIDFVQIPTTLLAMTDASVGGKTAVDLVGGKNQMGAFWQPSAVYCDPDALITLPKNIFSDGMAEVIKYGMLGNQVLLALLESTTLSPTHPKIGEVIAACINQKAQVVAVDEKDTGERQYLNFGHTFGHGMEKALNYSVSHGSAVAAGMAVMTAGAVAQGLCEADALPRLLALLERYHLPRLLTPSAQQIMAGVCSDKKRGGDTITLVIPTAFGRCMLQKTTLPETEKLLTAGLATLQQPHHREGETA